MICPGCNFANSVAQAKHCNNCGGLLPASPPVETKQTSLARLTRQGLMIVLCVAGLLWYIGNQGGWTIKRKGVTLAKYAAVQDGMTYAQVVALLGEPKAELSRNRIAGIETVMYEWQGANWLSGMNAVFQDGKLVQKAQSGLE